MSVPDFRRTRQAPVARRVGGGGGEKKTGVTVKHHRECRFVPIDAVCLPSWACKVHTVCWFFCFDNTESNIPRR